MIEINKLIKNYDRKVLKGVSYAFETGKIYVIKGISGCGKSTLLNIIGGVETDYEGECLYDGKDVKSMHRHEQRKYRQSCAYIFQNSLLISGITVVENLLYIRNDEEKIRYYASVLNVEDLLQKYPEQLSGGERQRISIIRTLLLDAKVILADEPTASLDSENADEIARIFELMRSERRIIIIATHANCFDSVADEILYLDYGIIGDIHKNIQKPQDKRAGIPLNENDNATRGKNSFRVLLRLIFKRNRKTLRITALIPMTMVIMAVLICFGVKNNFTEESMKFYQRNYPMDMIYAEDISTEQLLMDYDNIEVYKLYTIEMDDYVCYPMYDKEDSVLAYGNLIKYGDFPESDTDVLISNQMAKNMAENDDIESCIGKTLCIKDITYTITGVLADMDNDRDIDIDVYQGDWYYRMAEASSIVYIPYEMISQYGDIKNIGDYMVKIPGLYDIEGLKEEVSSKVGHEFPWEWKLEQAKDMVGTVNNIIMMAFVVVAVMAAIFIKNDIEVDLFYRKKELGYLQIFGVKKKTIWLQIILEKITKNIVAYVCAMILFHILVVVLNLFANINGFVALYHIGLLFFMVIAFCLISVMLPIRKFMKKSVLTLITE